MIALIDYGAGNLQSVRKALTHLGAQIRLTDSPRGLEEAKGVILPGVGAFGSAMAALEERGLSEAICRHIRSGRPFLGICLGLQLLFEGSEESPGVKGLGILPGKILHIPQKPGLKIPHMGWNSLKLLRGGSGLFKGTSPEPYVYFVHSYYLKADDPSLVTASVEYGTEIHAAVQKGNLFACQFHPEKSGSTGLQILRNFLEAVEKEG